ncbi:hypothetical protein ACOME3_010535 [Neoechinorhynchus agilis]
MACHKDDSFSCTTSVAKTSVFRMVFLGIGLDKDSINAHVLRLLKVARDVSNDMVHGMNGGSQVHVIWTVPHRKWFSTKYFDLNSLNDLDYVIEQNWNSVRQYIRICATECSWIDTGILDVLYPPHFSWPRDDITSSTQRTFNPTVPVFPSINCCLNLNFIFLIGSFSHEMITAVEEARDLKHVLELILIGDYIGDIKHVKDILFKDNICLYFITLSSCSSIFLQKIKAALNIIGAQIVVTSDSTRSSIRPSLLELQVYRSIMVTKLPLFRTQPAVPKFSLVYKIIFGEKQWILISSTNCSAPHADDERIVLVVGRIKNCRFYDKYQFRMNGQLKPFGDDHHEAGLLSGDYLAYEQASGGGKITEIIISFSSEFDICSIFTPTINDNGTLPYLSCGQQQKRISSKWRASDLSRNHLKTMNKLSEISHYNSVENKVSFNLLNKLASSIEVADEKARKIHDLSMQQSTEFRLRRIHGVSAESLDDITMERLCQMLKSELLSIYSNDVSHKGVVDWICNLALNMWRNGFVDDSALDDLVDTVWKRVSYYNEMKESGALVDSIICAMIDLQLQVALKIGRNGPLNTEKETDHEFIFEMANLDSAQLRSFRPHPLIESGTKNPDKLETNEYFLRLLVQEIKHQICLRKTGDPYDLVKMSPPTITKTEVPTVNKSRSTLNIVKDYTESTKRPRTAISMFNPARRLVAISSKSKNAICSNSKPFCGISREGLGTIDIPMLNKLELSTNNLSPFKIRNGRLVAPDLMELIPIMPDSIPKSSISLFSETECSIPEDSFNERQIGNQLSTDKCNILWTCGSQNCPRNCCSDERHMQRSYSAERSDRIKAMLNDACNNFEIKMSSIESQGGQRNASMKSIQEARQLRRSIIILKNYPGIVRRLFPECDGNK